MDLIPLLSSSIGFLVACLDTGSRNWNAMISFDSFNPVLLKNSNFCYFVGILGSIEYLIVHLAGL